VKILFEKQTCARCGGSGRHSYNQLHGDVCYGCGGSGEQLTKRARRLHSDYLDRKLKALAKPAGEVHPGDRVWISDAWRTVTAVEPTESGYVRADGTVLYLTALRTAKVTLNCLPTDDVTVHDAAKIRAVMEKFKGAPGVEVTE